MLQIVASGLEELKNDVVFVGGAVAELYADNPELSDIRPTQDVDCVIALSTKTEHARLEEALRVKKFANDTSQGAPICRWVYKNIKVDVMPTDSSVLGFSNRWYEEGIEKRITKTLDDGTEIYVFSPEYYIAAKFEAHNNRGNTDLRTSHDFEDIIYLLDNCSAILEQIKSASTDVKQYLKEQCMTLIQDDGLTEGIECALPYSAGEERADYIIGLIEDIAQK
jgi:predicted nucleotidyltransferase